MNRRALAAACILVVGMVLGGMLQIQGNSWQANAAPLPQVAQPQPGSVNAPVQPLILPGPGNGPAPIGSPPGTTNQVASPGFVFPDGFVAMSTEEAINVSVYEQANRSVVNISTKSLRPEAFLMVSEIEGSGSGSVFDKSGHVLTNYHVIEGAKSVNVTLFNGDSFAAELVGQDPDNDIAVLKIAAPESMLFPVPWGDSSVLRVGQHIIAIGNPFGLERTMSTGIISSLNRQINSKTRRPIRSIIQIDAALNQGNSGGPLLSSRGELIGMNTAIATRSGDNAGIGFAIPINTIRRVVPQLLTSGRVLRPTIGIMQVYETDKGLLVVAMTPGGPAERAGVRGSLERRTVKRGIVTIEQEVLNHSQADLIIGIDGKRVKLADDLLTVIETKKAGDQILLNVIRGGKQIQVPVVLGDSE